MTLVFACADAVQVQTRSARALAERLLDPATPATASGPAFVALWIQSLRSTFDLCRQIGRVVTDSPDRPGPHGDVGAGQIRFFVPVGAEATDPLPLGVPVGQVGAIHVAGPVGGAVLPAANVYVSVSSTGGQVQVALIGLDSIREFQELGSRCGARLHLPDGRTLAIVAART